MWPKDNAASWQKIHQFIAEFPDNDYWSKWKRMAGSVVSELEARGLGPLFRIGQSMHEIIFSTLDHHVFSGADPRVTLSFDAEKQIVRVVYSRSPIPPLYSASDDFPNLREPLSEEWVSISDAVQTTIGYLRRLWSETKPSIPLPDALKGGHS